MLQKNRQRINAPHVKTSKMCSRKVSAIHPGMIFEKQTAGTCFGGCPKADQGCIDYLGYSFLQRFLLNYAKPLSSQPLVAGFATATLGLISLK